MNAMESLKDNINKPSPSHFHIGFVSVQLVLHFLYGRSCYSVVPTHSYRINKRMSLKYNVTIFRGEK